MQSPLLGNDTILTLSEAANLLRVSEKTLGQMARQGRIPCQRVGREWRFLQKALQGWLAGASAPSEFVSSSGHNVPDSKVAQAAVHSELAVTGCRDTAFTLNKDQPLHRWVPWIAGFSASFVDSIFTSAIQDAPSEVTVLDPFAGVGTTLVQALKHGYSVLGFEINPYAYLACKSKLNLRAYDVALLRDKIDAFCDFMRNAVDDPTVVPRSEVPPAFISRHPFFSPAVLRKVLFVLDFIASENTPWIADLLRLGLGAQMVSFSNYTYEPSLGTRKAAGKADIQDADVAEVVKLKLLQIADDIEQAQHNLGAFSHEQAIRVVNGSCLEPVAGLRSHSVDLIVTSPPYLNNYHYLRNTRPQLHWLGLMPEQPKWQLEHQSFGKYWQTVRCEPQIDLAFEHPELAARLGELRATNAEKGPYGGPGWANYAACYLNDTYRFCERMGELLRPNGLMVIVIGNNILQGIEFQTDRFLAEIAERLGFETINMHTVRTKRTGSSILNSTARVGATSASLYETAVELRWRGL